MQNLSQALQQMANVQSDKQTTPNAAQNIESSIRVVEPENPSRRAFLKAGLFSAGGLVLAFNLPVISKARAAEPSAGSEKSSPPIFVEGWIQLSTSGELVLIVPAAEMGQGSQTALAMIFADELGADLSKVSVKPPLNNPRYNNPIIGIQVTGGSTAVRGWWQPLSEVAATLREMMRLAAAEQWQIKPELCKVGLHQIEAPSLQKSVAFEALIPALQNIQPVANPTLKKASEYRYIGKPMPRTDTAAKVDGSAVFGMDVELPGMLVATLAQSPVFGGTVDSYDEKAAMAVKGVEAVVPLEHAVAVVANGYWAAKKGLEALSPKFTGGKTLGLDNAQIKKRLYEGLNKEAQSVKAGGQAKTFAHQHQVTFEAPYLAHTTMEPMNATAWVHDNLCEVWAPTQNQSAATQVAADASLLQPSQVVIHTTFLGGGFGRRANVDYVAQAVAIAVEVGAPVKLIWSREEDVQHDFYRPAAVAQFDVKTDAKGFPVEWKTKVVSDSVMASFSGGSATMIDNAMSEGLGDQPYKLLNLTLEVVRENFNIPLGFWRSVGHSYTGFFMEGMLNELASKAKQDPIEYRMAMLPKGSRAYNVLDRLKTFSNWTDALPKNHAKGMASVESFGSFVGQTVEAHLDGQRIVVDKVYCVVDCGKMVNPEIVKRQMHSAIIYGLTAALHGDIEIRNGQVKTSNFDNYPMITLAETPQIEVEMIASNEAPGGYGEPGLPPLAPALTAAISQLTGKAYYSLPIKV